jgi:AcrR family transcriptional regulator
MSERRRYTLKERAASQEATRRRIVEAAVALHEELGPRATTVSAIAERAGVQRLTVYRHFPDDAAIFRACTGHWGALNPPPLGWQAIPDPAARRAAAIMAFNAYYRTTRGMLCVAHREACAVPALAEPMREAAQVHAALVHELAAGLGPRATATLAHALAFPTWEGLDAQGLDDSAKTALMLAWLAGAEAADHQPADEREPAPAPA